MKIFLITCAIYFLFPHAKSEFYTSVEELSRWPVTLSRLSRTLDEFIRLEDKKITRARQIRDTLIDKISNEIMIDPGAPTNSNQDAISISTRKHSKKSLMQNPVLAFVQLNRIVGSMRRLTTMIEEDDEESKMAHDGSFDGEVLRDLTLDTNKQIKKLIEYLNQNFPNDDDLIGAGEALLRLQIFYDLNIEDLIKGKVVSDNSEGANKENEMDRGEYMVKSIMGAKDCFELGRIAFLNDHFALAIQWLFKSLVMCREAEDCVENGIILDILEYMAFSAYKLDLVRYSAILTQAWLERDPFNERARDNLQYYLDELGDLESLDGTDDIMTAINDGVDNQHSTLNPQRYTVADDSILKVLCRRPSDAGTSDGRHPTSPLNVCREESFGVRFEILNEDPKVVRFYDIISSQESEHLMDEASKALQRSTIRLGPEGYQTSDFRIAKTAWISSKKDLVVRRIEERLFAILNISMDGSEDMQVVNYGLGGFYGPHLDSARSVTDGTDDLGSNDRYATVLIYLNHVQAGGSTVFPRLNLTIHPVERSAIVWFNLRENGFSDGRTLHTSCPVLSGSKWIATKWPREAANSFKRPCKRRKRIDAASIRMHSLS